MFGPRPFVKSCTAAACAAVVGKPTDPFGIGPSGEVLPLAAYYAYLTASDSHAVNKLLSKFISREINKKSKYWFPRLPPPPLAPPLLPPTVEAAPGAVEALAAAPTLPSAASILALVPGFTELLPP